MGIACPSNGLPSGVCLNVGRVLETAPKVQSACQSVACQISGLQLPRWHAWGTAAIVDVPSRFGPSLGHGGVSVMWEAWHAKL